MIRCEKSAAPADKLAQTLDDREEGEAAGDRVHRAGYLSGSGLKEYKKLRPSCASNCPPACDSWNCGAILYGRPPRPKQGHDENINF